MPGLQTLHAPSYNVLCLEKSLKCGLNYGIVIFGMDMIYYGISKTGMVNVKTLDWIHIGWSIYTHSTFLQQAPLMSFLLMFFILFIVRSGSDSFAFPLSYVWILCFCSLSPGSDRKFDKGQYENEGSS